MARSTPREWTTPAALIALSLVPAVAGVVRLVGLASGGAHSGDDARFVAAPVPVVLHIVSVVVYCLLGAFQFAPGFRRRRPAWHRAAGRVLVVSGLLSGLTGLWMTHFYPLPADLQGPLLYGFRLFIGSAMVASIAVGFAAVLRRDLARHRALMIRAYAIGQGAGTQVLVTVPWLLVIGTPIGVTRDLLMIAAWLINLAVAEWIIRGRPTFAALGRRSTSRPPLPSS